MCRQANFNADCLAVLKAMPGMIDCACSEYRDEEGKIAKGLLPEPKKHTDEC